MMHLMDVDGFIDFSFSFLIEGGWFGIVYGTVCIWMECVGIVDFHQSIIKRSR